MTNRRKKEIEKLAREKAFTLVFGDTFSAVETDLITRQLAIAEPGSPDESDPDETANTAPDETPPPTGSDEMEVYHRGIISDLVKEAKASRAAILDIVKYIFGLSPDETAAFLLKRSGGAFGTIEYSSLTDAVRELSKLPEVAAIRAAMKAIVPIIPERRKPYSRGGGLTQEQAVEMIEELRGIKISKRQIRNWNKGINRPPGYPGLDDTGLFRLWLSQAKLREEMKYRIINMDPEEMTRKRRK